MKNYFNRKFLLFLTAMFSIAFIAEAQTPSYKLSVANEAQTAPNIYEFDVYISSTSATVLELSNVQFGLAYDTAILNGGTINATTGFVRIAGTSDFPSNYTSGATNAGAVVSNVGGVNCKYLNCAASTIPPGGAGTGTIVPNTPTNCAAPGLRISRFRVTNSVPFTSNSTCKHVWSTGTGSGRTNTIVSAFIGSSSLAITQAASNYNYNQSGACNNNVVLNPAATCAVTIDASPSPVNCFGGNDGSVIVTLSGTGTTATGTYSIDGGGSVAYATNPFTVTGLTAGSHSISVTTTTPCSAGPTNFTIGGPAAPLGTNCQVITNVSCNGGNDGSVSVTGTGGTAPYTVSGPATSGLIAGDYTYTVTDNNGCQATCMLTITQPASPLAALASATDASCPTCADGSVTIVSVNGGTPTYTVDPPSPMTNLLPGTYCFTITDQNGCSTSACATVGSAACNVSANCSVLANVTCNGGSDGVVDVTGSGGTAPYTVTGNPTTGLSAGSYTYTVTDNNGCSSTCSLTITEPAAITSSSSVTACDSYTFPWGGSSTESGNFPHTYTAANGCDSVATIQLTINASTSSSETQTACDSYTWPVDGNTYTSSGTYTFTGTNAAGCPHVSTLILTINASTSSSETVTACDSYTWAADGQTYSSSGTYTATSTNAAGCPHVSTLILTINASTSSSETQTACDSYTWAADGQTYTTSGTYTATSTNAAGCPHVATLILTINSSTTSTETISACDSYTWAANGQTYTTSGTYTANSTNAAGCPHVSTLILTINASTSSSETQTACDSYTWAADGQTYTTSGTYTATSTNAAGCPHVSTLILTINSSTSSSESQTACDSYTWVLDGNTYTSSGTYTFTGTNAAGCPHVYTLILTINSSTTSTQTVAACGSYTWSENETTYTESGTYTNTGVNAAGCPHVSTLILTISNLTVTATPNGAIACFGGTVPVDVTASGGVTPYTGTGTFNQGSGTFTYTVTDNAGCTGTASVTLTEPSKVEGTIASTPANCGANDGTATVTPTGGTGGYTYLWDNGQTGASATGLSFGPHSVTITDNSGCTGVVNFSIAGAGGQPDDAGPISGPAGACVNQSGVVYSIAPVANATSYLWTLPAGASGSSTSNSITLSFGPGYAGGFICVTPQNSCGDGAQSCLNIPVLTVRPSQPGFIVGEPNPCGPNVFTYSIPPSANALQYIWSVTGSGVAILSGQGSNTVQISIPAGFGQGTINVKVQNCVGTTSTRTLAITGIPTHSNALIGPGYVCANTSGVAYTIGSVNGAGTSYVWSTTGDMSIATSNLGSCTVDFGPSFTTGTLSITTSSICGTFTRNYSIRSTPYQPGAIFGPGTNLCGQSGVTYSINPVPDASSYTWTVPAGVNMTSPNGGLSITVDFTAAFTGTGNICVSAGNSCGNSTSRCYSVTARPAVPGAISGVANPCKSSTQTYTVAPVAGATSYIWSVTGGATISPSGTSANINFNTATSTSAVITMNAVNSCGYSQPQKKVLTVNLGCRMSAQNVSGPNSLSLYPNPTNGLVKLDFSSESSSDYLIKITDLLGNVMSQEIVHAVAGLNMQEMDLSGYAKGMYLVSLETQDSPAQTLRLVVE